jgi:glycosyltransferase involved in cell wall biosynthesis
MIEHLVLIFAYHFPPENAVGGARPFRFSKYLSRLGYTCRVFTAAEQTGRHDPNTEYVPDPFVTLSRRSLKWQIERAVRKLLVPGELGTQWSYQACRAARAYVRAHSAARATVFSTFPPLGAHLAAWQLARSEGLPWIADFRDPFPDWLGYRGVYPHHKRLYRWLERAIARRADVILANTDGALAEWREHFPSLIGKVHLIWNGFDPEERVEPLPVPLRDYRVLSHVGHLYPNRTASPILESIARLIAAGRLPSGSVRVRLIGTAEDGALPNQEFLERAREAGWLELVTERIPQCDALQIARSSDGLLLLQPQSTTQVPGKLFEYIQIGRPILAFVPPDSSSVRLLERSGVPYRCVYPGSAPEAIDDAVARFFDLPTEPVAPSAWFEEQFNAEIQARMLHGIILNVHHSRGASHAPLSFAGQGPQMHRHTWSPSSGAKDQR